MCRESRQAKMQRPIVVSKAWIKILGGTASMYQCKHWPVHKITLTRVEQKQEMSGGSRQSGAVEAEQKHRMEWQHCTKRPQPYPLARPPTRACLLACFPLPLRRRKRSRSITFSSLCLLDKGRTEGGQRRNRRCDPCLCFSLHCAALMLLPCRYRLVPISKY